MYDEILRILDAELDKLKRARLVLTAGRTTREIVLPVKPVKSPRTAPPAEVSTEPAAAALANPPAEVQKVVAVTIVPPVRKRAGYSRSRTHASANGTAETAALQSSIPSSPVYVPVGHVKPRVAKKAEAAPQPELLAGSLDELIRDLKRTPNRAG